MRIAINARSILLNNRTGIGRYTYHLIDHLGRIDPGNEYWLYAQKTLWDRKRKLPRFSYPNVLTKRDLFGLGAAYCLKGADLYHSPSPGDLGVQDTKTIVTVHDLIYKTYPQSHTQETIDLTERYMRQIVRKADHIICVSNNTRHDLHRFLDFPRGKSSVIYNGVDHEIFYALNGKQKEEAKAALARKEIKDPFILFTGTLEPRKNLAGVLKAFAVLRESKRFLGKLVVVGSKGWMHQPTEDLMERLKLKGEVILLGYVSDEELRYLYNLAEVFVLPSFYEGFGFPIVEAFCCAAACVTSNNSSCGEIAGDAALTVDPQSTEQITQAMARLLEDKDLNQQMRRKAMERAKDFSFNQTARKTLKVYAGLIS